MPQPTDSAKSSLAKIIRAMRQRSLIEEYMADYAARKPFEVVTNATGQEVLRISEPPPMEGAIILGEMLYHFRSALDHLMYDLVERNFTSVKLPADWQRNCYFPLLNALPGNATAPGERKHFGKAFDALTDVAFAFVESLQPYQSGQSMNRLLGVLGKCSNIDKHRRLSTTVVLLEVHDRVITAQGFSSSSIQTMIAHDTELIPPHHNPGVLADAVDRRRRIIPHLALDESTIGPPSYLLVDDLMYEFPRWLATVVIPKFEELFTDP